MALLLAGDEIDPVVRGLVVRSSRCVTLRTVGKGVRFPDHNASCTRRWPRRGATHLTRGGPKSPLTKTVALPVSPPAEIARGNPASLRRGLRPDRDAVRQQPGLDVAPERDQKPPRHRHDGDPPRAPLQRADPPAEPCGERAAAGLV